MSEKKYEPEVVDLRMLRQRIIRHENWVKDPRAGEPLNLQHTDIRLALREAECAREAGAYQEADPLENRCLDDANLSDCLGLLSAHLAGSSLVRATLPSSLTTYRETEGERKRIMRSHQRFVVALLLWGIYIVLTFFSVPEIRWAMPTARVLLPLCGVSVPASLFLYVALMPYLFLGIGERRMRDQSRLLRQEMPSHFPDGQSPAPEILPGKLYAVLMGSGFYLALLFAVRCLSLHLLLLSVWQGLLMTGMLGIAFRLSFKRLFCLAPVLPSIAWCLIHTPSATYHAQVTARLETVERASLSRNTMPEYRTARHEEASELQARLAQPTLPLGVATPHLVLEEKKLTGTDMTGASLRFLEAPYSHWAESYFVGVDATGASFAHSHLQNVTFTRRTPHPPTRLSFADFTAANLSGIEAEGVEAMYANFTHATLTEANLRLANLTAANLHKSILEHANLSGAYLRDADLSEVRANNTQFVGAYASHARLDDTNLSFSNLHESNLQFASLKRANLHSSDLTGADIQDADCTSADFTDAKLEGVIFSSQTLWSSGKPWPDMALEKQYRVVSLSDREGKVLPNTFHLEKIPQKSDISNKK
jgi:uncharacterized protein YjbI with pentapeptide repeats